MPNSTAPCEDRAESVFAQPDEAPPPTGGERTSILDVAILLAERKRLIFLITFGFAVASLIWSLLLPKSYTATTTLLPPQQNSSMASALVQQIGSLSGMADLAGGNLAGMGMKSPSDLIVAMLKSRTVEDGMLQRFGLMKQYHLQFPSDARKVLESVVNIQGSNKDGLIHVSVEDHNPKRAAELANGYIDEFRKLSEHLAITEAGQRRLFFEQQLEESKDKLAKAEEDLEKTQQTSGMIQLDAQARALIESAASLRAQIAAKEVEIQSMETFATTQNNQVVQARQELAALQAQLQKLAGSGGGDDALILPRGQVTSAGLEYVRKLRDVKYQETIFEILARQFEAAKLDEAKEGAVIQVVDVAVPPDRKSAPKRALIVIAGTALGFFLGSGFALLNAAIRKMKADPEASGKLRRLRRALAWRA